MSTLSNSECAKFGRSMKAVPKIELCAGNKVEVEPLIRYIKYANGTLQKATLPAKGSKTTFYLGKS